VNSIVLMSVLCLPLLFGCSKAEEKRAPFSSSGPDQAAKPGEVQTPHYDGLIEEYRAVLAGDPNNLVALIALGNAYFDNGQWKEAAAVMKALLIDPRNADVRCDMGTAYRNLGMPERALAEYRLALKHVPGHLNARYNMGIVYAYDRKDARAAIHIWEELLKLAPNFAQADLIRSNMAALKQGTRKDAR
jgi:tetratricopeptide (TPR) repeat protein